MFSPRNKLFGTATPPQTPTTLSADAATEALLKQRAGRYVLSPLHRNERNNFCVLYDSSINASAFWSVNFQAGGRRQGEQRGVMQKKTNDSGSGPYSIEVAEVA